MFRNEYDYQDYLEEKYKSKGFDVRTEVEISKRSRIDLNIILDNRQIGFELKDFRKGNYTNILKRFTHLLNEVLIYKEDMRKDSLLVIGLLMPKEYPLESFKQILELFLSNQIYFLNSDGLIYRLPLKYVQDKKNIELLNKFNLQLLSLHYKT